MTLAFILYLITVLALGLFSAYYTKSDNDFLLAGRKLGPISASLSAAATSMSGWLLLGLPGEIFRLGLSAAWVGVGCIIGDYANWRFVAQRLHDRTLKLNAVTLSEFLSNQEKTQAARLVRLVSGLSVVFFMTLYLWAQFVATGKALSASFAGIFNYEMSVLCGALVIIAYTACGGLISVVLTDVLQASLMFLTLVGLPVYSLWLVISNGQLETIINTPAPSSASHMITDLWGGNTGLAIVLLLVSNLGIGAAYIGQPQIASRFMAIQNSNEIPIARRIAVGWVTVTCIGVTILSLCAHTILPAPPNDSEQVILDMASYLLPNWLAGIVIAAVMAAIMSSADSFLITAVASIQKDFVSGFSSLKVSRSFTLFLGIIATALAITTDPSDPNTTVFQLVGYAWGGLAIAFGVPMLYSLFNSEPNTKIILMTMLVGLVAMALWHVLSLSNYVYEVIPCMTIQTFFCLSILFFNR